MTSPTAQEIANTIIDRYLHKREVSHANDGRAKQVLPGGDTRNSTYFTPAPAYMERGQGCYLYDADENEYLDLLNNYTSLIHGHAHPTVIEAVRHQVEQGVVFGSAAAGQIELAEIICRRIPAMDMIRFCNSGTEATMMAIRAARAFSGKETIIKMDGGYHGSHETVAVNIHPDLTENALPTPHLEGSGLPDTILNNTLVARFNDLDSLETILQRHRGRVAAIILEPMPGSGGLMPPQPGYLAGVRALADQYDVLLIFDEIIVFRLSLGGLQAREGVEPDLTALGKIIGGGFPVGAFGGRREIMQLFDPTRPNSLAHSGTFNGHNVAMAAGIATLKLYDQAAVDHINRLGQRLRQRFDQAFRTVGLKGHTTGLGSLTQVQWGEGPINDPGQAAKAAQAAADLPKLLHLELMNRGIYSANRGMFITATPMTEREIDQAGAAFAEALAVLKPYAAQAAPHLV